MQALSGNVGDDRDSASIHLPVLGTSRVVIVIKVATIEFVHARHERSFEGQLRVGRHAVLRGVNDDNELLAERLNVVVAEWPVRQREGRCQAENCGSCGSMFIPFQIVSPLPSHTLS